MAELILTDKEKADQSYLDWDNDALGKLVRKYATRLQDEYGRDAAFATIGSNLLLGAAVRVNSEIMTQTIEGLTISGEDAGDWEIKITRIRKPQNKKE